MIFMLLYVQLNGLIGLIELLEKTSLSRTQLEYLSYLKSSANHLLGVLNDILTFTKLEAGKVMLEQKSFNLRQCMEAVIDTFRGVAHDKQAELILYIPHTCPKVVVGDEFRLTQVLTKYINEYICAQR